MRPFLKGETTVKKLLSLLLCAGVILSLAACNPEHEKITRELEAMDTYMRLELYGADSLTVTGITANIEKLDRSLSVTNADDDENEIYRVNQTGSGGVSPSVAELTRQALALCEETDGALDVTVGPLVEEWGFYSKQFHVPTADRLAALLPLTDYRRVRVEDNKITLEQKGMKLDFGAVAKGYAADVALETLRQGGTKSALLNLGGTVVACGEKSGGKPWRVGIADPDNSADYMGYLDCRDKVVATSGSYDRNLKADDGRVYSHIIDPKTGVPVDNDILSVTVIADSGIRSDGLSTALFVMGLEKAEQYREAHPDFDYVIITKDKKTHVTKGVEQNFTIMNNSFVLAN